jgi:hypothetical protein
MKNKRLLATVVVICCVGLLTHWRGVPNVRAEQAKTPTTPALAGAAYPGEIRAFAGSNCPVGWLIADGSEVKDADHPALVAAIGDLWGSSAVGKFKLPDLRGVFIRGWNNNRSDGDPQAADRTIPQGAPIDLL